MAGSTLASPTAERRAASRVGRGAARHARGRDLAALSPSSARRSRAPSSWSLMILAVAFGPLLWRVPINDIDFSAQLDGPSWAHPLGTDDLGQDLLARMLYGGRISLAVGLAAMAVAVVVGTIVGAIAGMSRGGVDAGADVADRPVPVAAAAAGAAADHLPVPRLAEGAGRAGARHLHPDRRGDRRRSAG